MLNQLFGKAEKCDFHVSTVPFGGFVVSERRVSMDPEKAWAV